MSLSLYSKSLSKNISNISSDISESNILNYKRRSRLVSSSYCRDTNKIIVKSIDTLKNFYNALFDFKNILSDNIKIVTKDERFFTKKEENYIRSLIETTKCEILSAYNIYCKNIDITKIKTDEKKIIKRIDDITRVLYLLYEDIEKYYKL